MTFHKNGAISCYNFHYYSDENPHAMRIKRHRKGNIFLRDDLVEVLENVPLTARRSIILQHDGFSAHYSHAVRAYLDIRFLDSWIGRRGPVRCALPPSTKINRPLSLFDLFLQDCINNEFCRTVPTAAVDMLEGIRVVFLVYCQLLGCWTVIVNQG